jgi:hypothetical protein
MKKHPSPNAWLRRLLLAPLVLSGLLLANADAARQGAVLIPIDLSGDNTIGIRKGALDISIAEKLADRFDVQRLPSDTAGDPEAIRKKARSIGRPYLIEGSVIRIGRSVSLELRIGPSDPGASGKTVVATARDESDAASGKDDVLPPIYRRLTTEATANLKLRFFGDDRGRGKGKIPGLSGTLTRSAAFPGNPVSAGLGDSDRDGKRELLVAFTDEIAVYRIEGDDLVEKTRIRGAGPGLVRIEVADLDQNGMAEIVAVRLAGGKPISDIWAFDGKEYRKFVQGLPWYLGVASIEKDGAALIGQEAAEDAGFTGPVFRIAFNRYGQGEIPDKGATLRLPVGTGIYGFCMLKSSHGPIYAVVEKNGITALFDSTGLRTGSATDPIRVTESGQPTRLLPIDLDGDGTDELMAVNNLVTPGAFFESVEVQSGAELLAFVQDAGALRLAWRTPQTVFGVRDAFVLENDPVKGRKVGLLVRDRGKLLETQAEWRIVWMR